LIEPHRPRLGYLVNFVEIARRAAPIADAAAERGAGEQAAGEIGIIAGSTQTVYGLV
jgi:hypothetical protein